MLASIVVNALLAMLNVFIDPAETVRRIEGRKMAWLLPVLIGGIVMGLYQWGVGPFTVQAMRADPPGNIQPEQVERVIASMQTVQRFTAIAAPAMFALMIAIGSALVFAMCAILSVNVRFPAIFNLLSHVSLINVLQMVAHYLVLKGKGEVSNMNELMPSFGLEMFLSESTPKMLYAFLGFFSVFTVWHIVILAIGFAAMAHISKGKAFLVTAPSWLFGLLFALIGALFR